MNAHLKNESAPVKDADDPPIDGKRLRVFPEDSDLPADARNARIDETFVDRAELSSPAPERSQDFKAQRLAALRALSFRPFPERIPPAQPREKRKANRASTSSGWEPSRESTWLSWICGPSASSRNEER